jgi:hypothetical protein
MDTPGNELAPFNVPILEGVALIPRNTIHARRPANGNFHRSAQTGSTPAGPRTFVYGHHAAHPGIGVGANTVIFSVIDGVLLKPLPYPHPEQIQQQWRWH